MCACKYISLHIYVLHFCWHMLNYVVSHIAINGTTLFRKVAALSLQAAVLFIPIKPVHQIGAILTWSRIFLSVTSNTTWVGVKPKKVFHKSWPRLCLNMKWRNHRIYRILDIATKYFKDLQSMYQNHVAICAYLCTFHPFPPHSDIPRPSLAYLCNCRTMPKAVALGLQLFPNCRPWCFPQSHRESWMAYGIPNATYFW